MKGSISRTPPLYNMILISLFAAVLCLLSPWAIPFGQIPVTLATMAVFLTAGTLGVARGTAAVFLYLCIGIVGLPVFSGLHGGIGVVLGFTGGFLVGYLPCAAVVGLTRRFGKILLFPPLCVVGTILCYLCGVLWYMHLGGVSFFSAILICVVPFLPFDAAKIALASLLLPTVWRAEERILRHRI